MAIIKDGTGTGYELAVASDNKAQVRSVTESEDKEAVDKGNAYNVNTGLIGLTSSTASGVLYFKNNEDINFHIEQLVLHVGSAGTVTDSSIFTVIKNPTSVSFSTAVDMNQNRNFGSSKTLTADAYKGAEAATVTGGDDLAIIAVGAGSRAAAPINMLLGKGDSVAVTADTNTTSGTTNVYVALVGHLENGA